LKWPDPWSTTLEALKWPDPWSTTHLWSDQTHDLPHVFEVTRSMIYHTSLKWPDPWSTTHLWSDQIHDLPHIFEVTRSIIYHTSLKWPDPWSTTLEVSMLAITPPMQFVNLIVVGLTSTYIQSVPVITSA
jgi:hypothetical protein